MWNIENKFKVKIGGNYYIDTPNVIVAYGESLFAIKRREEDGLLAVDFDVYDAKGKKVATIRNAHIVSGNKEDYDFKKEFHRYWVIEKSSGRTICDVRQKAAAEGSCELEVSVDLYTKTGFRIIADSEHTNIGGLFMKGCTMNNCAAGIVIN
ncbi:hypothetical protein [Horticoccus sp. 23ND18S-11]|uniref:hypothetical protein n=1 Tax=Horticoccus sp. 23ND18S-11 TaxID=3391832 RepID=UPI0039C95DAE